MTTSHPGDQDRAAPRSRTSRTRSRCTPRCWAWRRRPTPTTTSASRPRASTSGWCQAAGSRGMASPTAFWQVPDIESKLAEVTAAGATIKEPAHDVGGWAPGGDLHRPRRQCPRTRPGRLTAPHSMAAMDITINASFLPHDDPDAALAFYRDTLGFEVRNDVGYAECAGSRSALPISPAPRSCWRRRPPYPGITDDERRTIAEMMAKGTYADDPARRPGTSTPRSSDCRRTTSRSYRSRPTSPTGSATARSETLPATSCGSRSSAELRRSRRRRRAPTRGHRQPCQQPAQGQPLVRVQAGQHLALHLLDGVIHLAQRPFPVGRQLHDRTAAVAAVPGANDQLGLLEVVEQAHQARRIHPQLLGERPLRGRPKPRR